MTMRKKLRRGFFAAESAGALVLAMTLLMLISTMVVKQNQAEQRLSRIRGELRAAETAMLELAEKKELPAGFQMERLTDKAPEGYTWVRIHSLVGLAPNGGGAR